MSTEIRLRARGLDEGELDGAVEILFGLTMGDEARTTLARLGGVEENAFTFGDGWAASLELDGTTLLVRGEPTSLSAHWAIYAHPNTDGAAHAARRLHELVVAETVR